MTGSHIYEGQCHCSAIRATLIFTRPSDEVEVRACACGFCTRHGAMTISDPAGKASFAIREGQLQAYQFGTRTATSLLCQSCGVYAGVMLQADGETWSVVNVRGLGIPEFAGRTAVAVNYDAETADQRIARRMAKWTPTEIRLVR